MAVQHPAFSEAAAHHCSLGLILCGRSVFAGIAENHSLRALHKVALADSKVHHLHRQHVEQLFRELDWIRWPYQQVKVAHWDAAFTLMPTPYANLPLDEVGALMHGQTDEWQLATTDPEYQIAFHAEKGIQDWVQQSFEHSTLMHPWHSLLPLWQREGRQIDQRHVRIHVHTSRLSLAVLDGHEIIMANTFPYASQEDFLYFSLLAYEQLDCRAEEHPLILSGEIARTGQLYPLLYRYIRDVRFAGWPADWDIDDFVGHIPAHYYQDVLALLS